MKKNIVVILLLALSLGGCGLKEESPQTDVVPASPEEIISSAPVSTPTAAPAPLTALTEDELSGYEALFSVMLERDGEMEINPLCCFLTSYYDSVEKIDMQAFLRYFPGAVYGGEAEFEALRALPGWPFAELSGIDDMPVPLSRYRAEDVRQVLKDWAGLDLEDVDISPESGVYYLEEYDAFYNYTSDFGLEQPEFFRGERQGAVLRLYWQHWYDGERELTLRETEEGIRLLSFRLTQG